MNEQEEYGMEELAKDIEFLRKNNLIEVVGINQDGEWLYSLTKETKDKVDLSNESLWEVVHQLVTEAEILDANEE